MDETPLPIRLAQTIGLTTSSILSGFVLAASFTLVPRILESPTPLLLRQWGHTYDAGKKNAPPFTVLSSACYFYLAYALPFNSPKSRFWGYAVAGALTVGTVPYTLLVMKSVNGKLLGKVDETKTLNIEDELVEVGLGEETAHKLVDNWGVLNLGRALLLVLGSAVGTWTALN